MNSYQICGNFLLVFLRRYKPQNRKLYRGSTPPVWFTVGTTVSERKRETWQKQLATGCLGIFSAWREVSPHPHIKTDVRACLRCRFITLEELPLWDIWYTGSSPFPSEV